MKLAKALKLKNKLAGEVANVQRMIVAANVVEGQNQPPHDVERLMKDLEANQKALADLKGRISAANAPIFGKIYLMAEMKSRISFLRTIPTQDGTFQQQGRIYGGGEVKPVLYRATVKAADVERDVKFLSDEIERLQDELDEFNAKTEV